MYNLAQVKKGIELYIDEEILSKIVGWQKWTIATVIAIALNKSTNIFNELKNNPMVKALEIINKDDLIDVDTIYKELKKQADKGAITFDLPMIGAITLKNTDVDKLYSLIKEQKQ